MKIQAFETDTPQSRRGENHFDANPQQPRTVNLAEQGLCALRYEDDDKARAFYDRHKPPVYVMDTTGSSAPVSFYVYKDPGVDACLVDGIELFRGEMPFDTDEVDLTGDLSNAPDLPAEFYQKVQQSPPFDQIPTELREHDQWVLWRYVERDGKPTKVPYQLDGLSAKSNDPGTWTSFNRVKGKYDEGGFDGIGFALSEHDGLAGIDLDKCYDPETKQFNKPEAEEIVRRALALGTYIEITPSGSGFRIFVKGSLQRSGKAPGAMSWIEAYDHRSPRYLTVTGARFEGADVEIQPGQEFLDWLHESFLKKPDPTHQSRRLAPGSISPAAVDDDVLISQIRGSQNEGPRFTELFDQGRLINRETGELNDDHSSADFALCGILARWTERSAEQLDRIFRRSALMRNKWDERHSSDGKTYGEMTVEKAIVDCAQTRKEWVNAQRQADKSYVTESLNAADPAVITSAEFASALYRVSQKDPLALIRWEKQGDFKRAKLSKKDVALIVNEGAKLSEDARTNLPYSTDVHPDIEAAIAELNAKFCVAWMGGNLNVMRFVVSDEHVNGGYVPTTKSDVGAWYANKLIEIPNAANNETIRINPASAWWSSKEREEYDGVEFHPGREKVIIQGNKRILNLWGGWSIDPLEGDITPFLELLLRVVCAGDTAKMERALDWMAHLFQQPACLPSTALLFRGGQGWGKNSVIDTLAKPLGSSFLQVSTPKQLTGDFNAHMANKLLIHGAESVWGGEKSKVGSLKAMITDEHQAVEHKGRDVFQVKNFKRLILSSNEKWPVPMDLDDRRFLVFTNTKIWGTGDPFWSEFRRWRGDHTGWEGAARLFGFLLDRDISNFKPWAKPAEFTDGWDLKIKNSDGVTQWWYAMLRDGEPEALTTVVSNYMGSPTRTEVYGAWDKGVLGGLAIQRKDFWAACHAWLRQTGTRNNSHEIEWKRELRRMCPSTEEKQLAAAGRSVCFVFPDLEQCRKEFAQAVGADVNEVFAESEQVKIMPTQAEMVDALGQRLQNLTPPN